MGDFKIEDVTVCLHCGSRPDIVERQIEALKGLGDDYNITWNNRIDRYPHAYPSYSELINDTVATSKDEFIVFVNDRCFPTADEGRKMLNHLQEGYAASFLYSVGYMAFSKELVRKIGWWDQRFLNGGWEDRDWIIRLAEANLKIYESQESDYSHDWKSPLQVEDYCALSTPHFNNKWGIDSSTIIKRIKEESYIKWENSLGAARPDISETWGTWDKSTLGIDFNKPNSGPPGSSWVAGRQFILPNEK
tara:strand:+ start:114 stop:857 length:744 start_codon:yes stop_codon:yes gene_type:complete